jgi:hypothetical protein
MIEQQKHQGKQERNEFGCSLQDIGRNTREVRNKSVVP